MDQNCVPLDSETNFPFLLIPRDCTTLETNCDTSDNVFIDVSITSLDTEGNETCIYSGYCNVKLIDNYNVNINQASPSETVYHDNERPVIISDPNQILGPPQNQSHVWIDPARSPFVYNNYVEAERQDRFSSYQGPSHIMVQQHNTYITQNVYNYKESTHYTIPEDVQHKKYRQSHEAQNQEYNMYEEDEFECGVFLSQLPKEIINESENKEREERKYIGLQSDNGALKQLMSSDIQSISKQRKRILFLGPDSHSGQTIQNIQVNDPMLQCAESTQKCDDISVESSKSPTAPQGKKYQCDKCKQIFNQIAAFRQHMVSSHRSYVYQGDSKPIGVKFMCSECGKTLKNQEKFEIHCMGHGDPDLECNRCHKVFASKFTLRNHRKIHSRKHPCCYCLKSYTTAEELKTHVAKVHFIFTCDLCPFVAKKFSDLNRHQALHESDFNITSDDASETDTVVVPEKTVEKSEVREREDSDAKDLMLPQYDQISEADSVIAKVMSNKIFLLHAKKVTKRQRKYNKECDVCLKRFERIGDLKRHLIEHIIKSTLAKTPVNDDGTLTILCEVCQVDSFTKIDRYKAHLREHAKLTLYQCTFCNKSFSDSSNFSKHKKIHGTTYFQCDLCQRKFNSKKMIAQHMVYHNNNSPMQCHYCDRVFHFESMLNKHIKCAHVREINNKHRCRFCHRYFKTLKEKWDHEWNVHSVRKVVVDCLACGCKFRKYSELKRHCISVHNLDIPRAKHLLKNK